MNYMIKDKVQESEPVTFVGTLKWFCAVKGFGFLEAADISQDVLMHGTRLGPFGRNAFLPGAQITFCCEHSPQGPKVTEIIAVDVADVSSHLAREREISELPLLPAAIRWFDHTKGFGFANVFGNSEDIFVHANVAFHCGIWDLKKGSAIGIRSKREEQGLVVVDMCTWENTFQ